MSDDPKRAASKVGGCAAVGLVPVGMVVGYFCGVYYFCPPGAGNECGVLGVFVGVPIGAVVGFIAYFIVRVTLLRR